MKDQEEFLENIVIDVCKRTFMLYSDDGRREKLSVIQLNSLWMFYS